MKTTFVAAFVALSTLVAAPALAQAPAKPMASAPAGKFSVETTTVGDILKNPDAKAALEKTLPDIKPYYDQVGTMTLRAIQPMSQGAITDDQLKTVQADFDKIK